MIIGGKIGFIEIFKSISKTLIGTNMPLDELAGQSMLFGTHRAIGPFPSSVPWSDKMRGVLGFDVFGTIEGLSDPRTWQHINAYKDLEHEYILKTQRSHPIGMTSFTFDSAGDTSEGKRDDCDHLNDCLDLTKPDVQRKYYDPESARGFNWLSNVKFNWDGDDVFHSRFTIPPQNPETIFTAVPW